MPSNSPILLPTVSQIGAPHPPSSMSDTTHCKVAPNIVVSDTEPTTENQWKSAKNQSMVAFNALHARKRKKRVAYVEKDPKKKLRGSQTQARLKIEHPKCQLKDSEIVTKELI